ncbi:hypothetical protein K523DRAFT_325253 [Schizophyllum commune Tattone D]|nr:hypothetical protein K523DRAFT_325253 [Schizophyllum commune Tattone D]
MQSRRLLRACMPARSLVTGVTSHKVACLLRRTRSTSPTFMLSLEGVRCPGSVLREPEACLHAATLSVPAPPREWDGLRWRSPQDWGRR